MASQPPKCRKCFTTGSIPLISQQSVSSSHCWGYDHLITFHGTVHFISHHLTWSKSQSFSDDVNVSKKIYIFSETRNSVYYQTDQSISVVAGGWNEVISVCACSCIASLAAMYNWQFFTWQEKKKKASKLSETVCTSGIRLNSKIHGYQENTKRRIKIRSMIHERF